MTKMCSKCSETKSKKCNKCDEEKLLTSDYFYRDCSKKDGFTTICKNCGKLSNSRYRAKNKDKIARRKMKYASENKEKIKEYKDKNRERINKLKMEWHYRNRDEILKKRRDGAQDQDVKRKKTESDKRYREKNKEQLRKKRREKYKNDPVFRLRCNLRWGLHRIIKKGSKSETMRKYLGCSVEELVKYLEKQFEPGMSWNNYGKDTWHIDHIMPISSIQDENDIEQIKAVCHYSNLRPLWAKENWEKSNKIL